MPRPKKHRHVCCMPQSTAFGPVSTVSGGTNTVIMTVEEYETLRLIDYEGLMQEECAERMNVARTTVQRIYNDARKKTAEFLVGGKALLIEGGDFVLCDDSCNGHYNCGKCNGKGRRHGFSNDPAAR